MGAVLLTDLVSFIQRAYKGLLFFDATYAWSDSRVTLCWLSASPHRWKTFVANRVAQVQSIVPSECWHYVPSAENPADYASRGLLPSQLLAHPLWWTGPPWLRLSNDNWPEQSLLNASSVGVDLEQKATVLTTYLAVSETDVVSYLLNRSSSLQKVKRVLAYILRFPKRARQNADRSYNPLSEEELQQALYKIVQHVQQECFSFILVKLKANSLLPKPFRRLAPFVDSGGLLRVGGRLQGSQFSYERQHPLLLPKNNRLTDLVVEEVHRKYMHPGFKTLHYLILQQYWILSPRSAIYRRLSRCIRCFRCKPKAYTPIMGNLPSFRVSQMTWQLARIIRLHPGHDSVARVATVKTVNGTMLRPIAKLCPLPLFNPIENIQTGSTNSIARMNFVWTRERSKRSNTTRVRTVERWVPVSKKNIFLRFSIFSVLRQLTRSHKTTRRILQEAGLLSTRICIFEVSSEHSCVRMPRLSTMWSRLGVQEWTIVRRPVTKVD
nr:unnamed protein product [Callosobruchus analis]